MENQFNIRKTSAGIIVAAFALAITTPARANPITLGVFEEFGFSTAGTLLAPAGGAALRVTFFHNGAAALSLFPPG